MMKYLSCSGDVREFVALAAVPADAGSSASVLLLTPVIRTSDAGKVALELRFGETVLHHCEWELAAGAVFHLPGKWVLNAGYSLYFASYAAGASLEACAVVDGDFSLGNGISGGYLQILIPPGAWYVKETQVWILGCKGTWSLDENGMPDIVTYSDLVAVPRNISLTPIKNNLGSVLTSAVDLSEIAFSGLGGGQGGLSILHDGPYADFETAAAAILAEYNAIDPMYQIGIDGGGASTVASCWQNENLSIEKWPENKLITGQYGPSAPLTPGTPKLISEILPMRDISDAVAAFPSGSVNFTNFGACVYEEVYP